MGKSILILLILLGMPAGGVAQSSYSSSGSLFPDEFPGVEISSVYDGLMGFIGKIPKSDLMNYGFLDEAEFRLVTLGIPFRLYQIHPQAVLGYREGTTIDQILEGTSQWFFPVFVNYELRAMMVVHENHEGAFNPVSFGYVSLAAQIGHLFRREGWVDPSQCKLAVVYQAKEFFMARPALEPNRLYPLQYYEGEGIRPAGGLGDNMKRIRKNVETNLGEGK